MYYYMVLEDGETFSMLEGCKIVATEVDIEEIDSIDSVDEEIAEIALNGETEHGKVVAEFTAVDIKVSSAVGASISLP